MLGTDTLALIKSNVARSHPMERAAYWDVESGTETGNDSTPFISLNDTQNSLVRFTTSGALVKLSDKSHNVAYPRIAIQLWTSPIDRQLAVDATEDIALANSNTRQDLVDALEDLSEVLDEAEEKGYQVPSEMAVSKAKSLLETMYEIAPQRFEVYPMPQGEVTIDATDENGHYLMLLIASDGSARSLINSANGRSRRHFASTDDITTEFLRDTFLEIDVSDG